MKHTFKLSMLCSAILLAGCGDNTSSSGTSDKVQFEDEVQALLDRGTSISFTLQGANADVPAPSYLLMDTTDGTLGLPTDGDDALTNPRASMNTMDGWSTSMPIVLNFKGDGFATGMLPSGIKVIKINQRLTEWMVSPTQSKTFSFRTKTTLFKQKATLYISSSWMRLMSQASTFLQ